mmetsp:Transcript_13841/g.30139  ORF Transcript_13841/g.30139 Transcript_13841/m.30139 type:complete len:226 (+) Transcript_13841:7931-8608(+)
MEIDLTAPTANASARAKAPSSPMSLLSKIIFSKIVGEVTAASTSALPNAFDPASVILLLLKSSRLRQPGLDDMARASASAPASPTLHDDKSNSSNTFLQSLSFLMAILNAAASATVPASPMALFPPMRSTDGLYLRLFDSPLFFLSNAFKIPLPTLLQNAGPIPQFSTERILGINAAPPPSNSLLTESNIWTLGEWMPWPPMSLNDKSSSSTKMEGASISVVVAS